MPSLNWLGRDAVVGHHYDVPYHFLDRRYGSGDNMIIHGDNLLALKSLMPKYERRIKLIYIDPPYNTGNEGWVYNDNVNDPVIKKWLGEVVGREGEDFTRHDKWLCMMYPRLRLMQMLLADDGAIFISIDDNEQANLRLICDEIFGAMNFVAQCSVRRCGARQDSKHFAVVNEYLLCYAKCATKFRSGRENKVAEKYPKYDASRGRFYKTQLLRKWGANSRREDRPNLFYPITAPDGSDVYPMLSDTEEGRWRWSRARMQTALETGRVEFVREGCWRWSRARMQTAIEDGRVEFVQRAGEWIAYEKIFEPTGETPSTKKYTTWIEDSGSGADTLKNIFDGKVFDYPKSVELIERVLRMGGATEDSIVLDAFGGSGTTAHAVINLNHADGGKRKFILIESQPYAETIIAERVRRVDPTVEFSYYELGERLLLEDRRLNPAVDLDRLREYVYFSETRQPLPTVDRKYLLGIHDGVAYYFLFDRDRELMLTADFVFSTLDDGAIERVIFASATNCGDRFLGKYRTEFRRIPSGILQW